MWVFQVLLYGLIKGSREIVKKKSLERNSILEVLFFYTLFAFLFVCTDVKNATGMDFHYMPAVAFKAFVIFLAWMLSFKAIKKMPISLYGILDLSRVLFATLLAVVVMHEVLSVNQWIGLILVSTGLIMLKRPKKKVKAADGQVAAEKTEATKEESSVTPFIVIIALISCMLNSVSGLMDKILTLHITSSQLQFWYMLFLVGYYFLFIVITREKIDIKKSLKNPWIWLLALLFVIADRSLFLANANPNSRISVMTLIKQSGCIVTILAGKFIFHEKHIGYKLLCAAVVIAGIVIAVM